jgi:hypothetical protein
VSFDALLRHVLVVKRNVQTTVPVHVPAEPTDGDPIFDDYGQPVMAESTVATVPGRIEPKSAREVALLSQAGAVVSTHTGYVRPLAGLDAGCWIESGGVRYDIVGMPDAAGAGHHVELELVAVV